MKALTNNLILTKNNQQINIIILISNKKYDNYNYLIYSNNNNRLYSIDNSIKLYSLLNRLYNKNFNNLNSEVIK